MVKRIVFAIFGGIGGYIVGGVLAVLMTSSAHETYPAYMPPIFLVLGVLFGLFATADESIEDDYEPSKRCCDEHHHHHH